MKEFYLQHFWVRVLGYIFLGLLLFVFVVWLFLKLWPSFGGRVSKSQQEEYRKRANNYVNGKFQNETSFSVMSKRDEENHFVSTKGVKPLEDLPSEKPSFLERPEMRDFSITWFGHSTLLIQMSGMNILVDPIFSDYASPVQFIGPKRFSYPSITIDEIPNIDIVLITHDHYDHLDYLTIRKIDSKVGEYIVPLGVENHLIRWNVSNEKIHNMAWWEETNKNGLTIACTPAQHFSGRSLGDQFDTLWASFILKNEYYTIFESGDTGFGGHFREIHEKYGDISLALLDSGQYNVRWSGVHMNPDEVIKASNILNANVTMPIHYGAFSLSVHPWDDMLVKIDQESELKKVSLLTPNIGQTITNINDFVSEKWWQDIK